MNNVIQLWPRLNGRQKKPRKANDPRYVDLEFERLFQEVQALRLAIKDQAELNGHLAELIYSHRRAQGLP